MNPHHICGTLYHLFINSILTFSLKFGIEGLNAITAYTSASEIENTVREKAEIY